MSGHLDLVDTYGELNSDFLAFVDSDTILFTLSKTSGVDHDRFHVGGLLDLNALLCGALLDGNDDILLWLECLLEVGAEHLLVSLVKLSERFHHFGGFLIVKHGIQLDLGKESSETPAVF